MLAEVAGVKRIIIACGRTDLRKVIDGLSQIIGTKYDMNPFKRMYCFSSVAGVETVSKDFYGKETNPNVKYVNSSALHRVEQEFGRNGVNVSRQTMSNWIIRCSDRYFTPL